MELGGLPPPPTLWLPPRGAFLSLSAFVSLHVLSQSPGSSSCIPSMHSAGLSLPGSGACDGCGWPIGDCCVSESLGGETQVGWVGWAWPCQLIQNRVGVVRRQSYEAGGSLTLCWAGTLTSPRQWSVGPCRIHSRSANLRLVTVTCSIAKLRLLQIAPESCSMFVCIFSLKSGDVCRPLFHDRS